MRALLLAALAAAPGCSVISSSLLSGLGGSGSADAGVDARGADAAPADAAVTPPSNMLVLDYEFEDGSGTTVTDGARGINGSLSDASMWGSGRNGGGIAMISATPASQYVSMQSGSLSDTTDFTIAAWVDMTSSPAWARIYDIGNGVSGTANRFMYLTTQGFPPGSTTTIGVDADSYSGAGSNDESTLGTSTALPTGVWKHVAITGTGGTRRIYIDGFPAADLADGPAIAPKEMEPLGGNSWLGKSRFTSDPGFPGSIDEFKIYSRVLAANEIEDLAWPKKDYAYWRFDEVGGSAAKDSSDYNFPTALAGGAGWTTGRLGGAIDFGGGPAGPTGPSATIDGNPLADCSSQFTISLWLSIHATATNSHVLDFGAGGTLDLYLAPSNGSSELAFGMASPRGSLTLSTSPLPANNTWHHVALTMDAGAYVSLYVDGTLVQAQSSSTVRPSDFAGITQAYLAKSRGNDPYFDGSLDELRIACRAYTSDEIKNLAHQAQ